MKRILLLLTVSLLVGCCPKLTPIQSHKIDSVRVERVTEYRETLRMDTVYVSIPSQSTEVTKPPYVDGSDELPQSHLETDHAASDARINPDGSLYHKLWNKPQAYPVVTPVVDTESKYRTDSIVYRDVKIEVPVDLPLSKWQKFWIWSGVIGWVIIVTFLIVKLRGRIKP